MNARRNIIKSLGVGMLLAGTAGVASAKLDKEKQEGEIKVFPTVADMLRNKRLQAGQLVYTQGYYQAGDGGHANYILQSQTDALKTALPLENGLFAQLAAIDAVNYRMFGAKGDGQYDDGIAIKAAHQYANAYQLPVHNLNGEFWIKETHSILIQTSVDWGETVIHIDETFNNTKDFKFIIGSRQELKSIDLEASVKQQLVQHLVPGVQEIAALAPYRGSLIYMEDKNDRVGYREGDRYGGQSWAKQELFFVEDHGKVLGDIAYEFKDISSFEVIPVDDTYLYMRGGCFVLTGNSTGTGYTKNGFLIRRSRTIIAQQVVRLEQGASDVAMVARTGFYNFHKVFEVRLEDIKLIPYEQDREGKERDVPMGTYGISGDRILYGTFRNVTAEGGKVHWGVFGTNMNKNFSIEQCKLNRVDVHFHCWNLRILNSQIGFRGISVTGGGDLTIQNCTVEGRNIVNFRRDFGSKWDGDIRISNVRFMPIGTFQVCLLDLNPANFNYHYPIVLGKTIILENIVVDALKLTGQPEIYAMSLPVFSKMSHGERVIFPSYIEFSNISCRGKLSGLKILNMVNPEGFYTEQLGSYDGIRLARNVRIKVENVDLEAVNTVLTSKKPYHVAISSGNYAQGDAHSLYLDMEISNCKGLLLQAEQTPMLLQIRNTDISALSFGDVGKMEGRLTVDQSFIAPEVTKEEQIQLDMRASLGAFMSNTIIYSPRLNGEYRPDLLGQYSFIKLNGALHGNHVNSRLGPDILGYVKQKGMKLTPAFLQKLSLHTEAYD